MSYNGDKAIKSAFTRIMRFDAAAKSYHDYVRDSLYNLPSDIAFDLEGGYGENLTTAEYAELFDKAEKETRARYDELLRYDVSKIAKEYADVLSVLSAKRDEFKKVAASVKNRRRRQ